MTAGDSAGPIEYFGYVVMHLYKSRVLQAGSIATAIHNHRRCLLVWRHWSPCIETALRSQSAACRQVAHRSHMIYGKAPLHDHPETPASPDSVSPLNMWTPS